MAQHESDPSNVSGDRFLSSDTIKRWDEVRAEREANAITADDSKETMSAGDIYPTPKSVAEGLIESHQIPTHMPESSQPNRQPPYWEENDPIGFPLGGDQ